MNQINGNRRRSSARRHRPAATALTLALIALALLLSACGGSSSKSAATTAASKAAGGARGQFAQRGAALRECLQKNGITLPKRNPGQARKPGTSAPFGGAAGGGPQLPKGITRTQLQAALKKCGGGGRFAGRGGLASAAGRQRFAKFATCMKADGVNLPAPNTTGKGPIFNTKGIDTTSAKFKAAESKCMHELTPGGTGGAGGTGAGAPGAAQGETGGPAGTPGGPPVGEAGAPPAG